MFIVIKLCQLIMLDKQGDVGPAKPPDRPDHEVDDPLSNDIDHSIAFSEAIIGYVGCYLVWPV